MTFAMSGLYVILFKDKMVSPLIWALTALATHGLGVWIGWFVFVLRRKTEWNIPYGERNGRIKGEYFTLAIVLGFSLAILPTWLATINYVPKLIDRPFTDLCLIALQLGWPWAFLGSATAVAIFTYLEYLVDGDIDWITRVASGLAQGATNVSIAVSIVAAQTVWPVMEIAEKMPKTFSEAVALPNYELVFLLTGLIGLFLGLLIPSAFKGIGREKRLARRTPVPADYSDVSMALRGAPTSGQLVNVSLTGARVRVDQMRGVPGVRQYGSVVLKDGLRLPAQFIRLVKEENASLPDLAFWFSTDSESFQLDRKRRKRLMNFIAQFNPPPQATFTESVLSPSATL